MFPPERECTRCLSERLSWTKSSGRGRVHTYTVVWRPQQLAFEVPYVIAVVQLEEGWHMYTNMVDYEPEVLKVGAEVEVVFRPVSEEITLPMFRLSTPT